ncbi:MAG: hypothetical protein WBA07_14985 [Rivularia sp. (in: cyanobacteria)]
MTSVLYKVFLKFLITASILIICLGCSEESKNVDKSAIEPAPQTKTKLDIAKAIVGYWVTQTGQLKISQSNLGRIYAYDWYAIKSNGDGKVIVTWDDSLNCSKTEGQIVGNTIQLTAGDVKTELVVRDSNHATITFRDSKAVYVKQLVKQREDATVICQ